MAGYKVHPMPTRNVCPKCQLLARDAVQTSCGHHFCQSCADDLFKPRDGHPIRCPRKDCQEELTLEDGIPYFPDHYVRKAILKLPVACNFQDNGCSWNGTVEELEDHLEDCEYTEDRAFIRPHEETNPFKMCNNDSATHAAMPISTICKLQSILLEVKRAVPLRRAQEEFVGLNSSFIPKTMPGEAAQSTELPQQPAVTKEGVLQHLMPEELEKDELLVKKDEEIASLKASVAKLEKQLRAKNTEIEDRDFRLSLIENIRYDGNMVWKIPQFSQRMTDAENGKYTSIFSLPFYTSRYGFKMCLRLYILGDSIGKNTHMSLFFVIMRGEFDNILQWPFTHKVTFKLLNQTGGRDILDTFQPDPMSSSFKKPKSDMNIASGCPRFVSHQDLKNGGFVLDDTIFIKCTIDKSAIRNP